MAKRNTLAWAKAVTGGVGYPSKMPGTSYGTPASMCHVGGILRQHHGTVCSKCYACKNNYCYKSVAMAQHNRAEAMRKARSGFHPYANDWVDAMALLIEDGCRKRCDNRHRWFDSGDLQSVCDLDLIARVCEATPSIRHRLPTKEYAIVLAWLKEGHSIPHNLCISMSGYKIDGKAPAWPARYGLQVSTCYSKSPAEGGFDCPARKQGNRCDSCDACWNRSVKHVAYHLH